MKSKISNLLLLILTALMVVAATTHAAGPASLDMARVRAAEDARIALINRLIPSVVCVYAPQRAGGGAGVIYAADGYALTNFHVVAGAGQRGPAGLADNGPGSPGSLYDWEVVGIDPGGDLAVIKLSGKPTFPFSPLGDSRLVRVGDWVMAMGNPFALAEDQTPSVSVGIVSGVERYQPGEGAEKLLEYGNCIQVDSSINPGNSGGPLFTMTGQVVGINGRASFEERGRVNVGVGYAISAEQVKNFIPELEATKVALHATLDATFIDRDGVVICERIDRNSAMGRLGMLPGDRLVAFDGQLIRSSNQYLNWLTTLPAGWPVQLVWDREGQTRSAWLRLAAMPLPENDPAPAAGGRGGRGGRGRGAPGRGDGRGGGAPAPGRGPQVPPNEAPAPIPAAPPPATQPSGPTWEGGKINVPALNRQAADRVLARWNQFRGGTEALSKIKAVRLTEDTIKYGEKVGSVTRVAALDGREAVETADLRAQIAREVAFADMANTAITVSGEPVSAASAAALALPISPEILATVLYRGVTVKDFDKIELQGADKTQNQRAYRIFVRNKKGERVVLWFSLFNDDGDFQARLLKAAVADEDGRESERGLSFSDYRRVDGVMLPHSWQMIKGLAEEIIIESNATKIELLAQVPEASFEKNDANAKPPTTRPAP